MGRGMDRGTREAPREADAATWAEALEAWHQFWCGQHGATATYQPFGSVVARRLAFVRYRLETGRLRP